jgi:monovalent cation:H+ antiporter, CPA1 family
VISTGVATLVVLLGVAMLIALLTERLRLPYVVVLALVGVVAGQFVSPLQLHLTSPVILFILLPGLLFEASFNLNWHHLRDNLAAVVALATLGVFLTTAVAGLLVHQVLGLSLTLAIVFGAIIAPTDPVAVVAVFRRLGAPSRLTNLVESESLLNDGTGVVVFGIALGFVNAGGSLELGVGLLQFVELALGGMALGLALGFALSTFTRFLDSPQLELTLTLLAAYGGYLLAETLHVSGILTVVGAGLVLGNYGRPRGMSERTRVFVDGFWDYVAFLLNSFVFLLIGLDLPLRAELDQGWLVPAAFGIVMLARAVSVYGLFLLLRPVGRVVNLRWQSLVVWAGLRGAVATALLLSLPQGREFERIKPLAYGVVLLSILVQGATVAPLTRLLLPHGGAEHHDHHAS